MTIELSGLEKSFGPIQAVRGVDLAVSPGEVVALLGPNGAGKSTTLDMLLGLLRPDRGGCALRPDARRGDPPRHRGRHAPDRRAAPGPDRPRAAHDDRLAATPAPMPLADLLDLTGIGEFADQRTHKLSGGQTQRVRFAMALCRTPTCSCSTSRPWRWTSRPATCSGSRCGRSAGGRRPSCSPPTTWRRPTSTPTGSSSWPGAGSWPTGRPPRSRRWWAARTIEATLPGADADELLAVPGVTACVVRGDVVTLTCSDSDAALRALLPAYPAMHTIEIRAPAWRRRSWS